MKTIIDITIPELPTSLNHIYKRNKFGSTYKTRAGKKWQRDNATIIWLRVGEKFAKIEVSADIYFPNNIRRDLDNYLKLLSDAITDSGIVEDDNWKMFSWGHIRGHLDKE